MPARLWILAVVLAAAVATSPTWQSLWVTWRQVHDYQHGGLIALIAVAWLVLAVRRGPAAEARPSWPGIGLLLLAALAWLVAHSAQSQMAHQMIAPGVVWLAVLAVAGPGSALAFAAPIGFMYFATPVWDYAVPFLQRLSVWSAETSLSLAGVSAQVEEYRVTIPEGTFRIIEGCSGKRFFMVAVAMGVLSSAINGIRGLRAVAFVAACGLLAMFANYVRIFIVIYAGHVTQMQHYFVAVEHKSLGNAIFAALLLVILLLARRLAPPMSASQPAAPRPADKTPGSPTARLAVLGVLAGVFALVHVRSHAAQTPPALGALPLVVGDWQGPLPPAASWQPRFPGAADSRRAAYRSVAGAVELYINVYGEQRQGAGELVYFGNSVIAPGGWKRSWPLQSQRMPVGDGEDLLVFEATGPAGDRWVVAQVYGVGGKLTSSELMAQLSYGVRSILRPEPSGLLALAVSCDPNCEAARALVKSFWDDMAIPVRGMWPGAGSEAGNQQ